MTMKKIHTRRFLLFALLSALIATLTGGVAFVGAHPKCENCGRRYGPLIPHPYRHMTTKAAERARTRATAPIINSLPPITAANKNLQLSLDLLVGRWESQDGTRSQILFHPDGVMEYDVNDEQGRLAQTGTYAIRDGRVEAQSWTKNGTPFKHVFKFARGVLYAPRGPSPQVVWRRVGDL